MSVIIMTNQHGSQNKETENVPVDLSCTIQYMPYSDVETIEI